MAHIFIYEKTKLVINMTIIMILYSELASMRSIDSSLGPTQREIDVHDGDNDMFRAERRF